MVFVIVLIHTIRLFFFLLFFIRVFIINIFKLKGCFYLLKIFFILRLITSIFVVALAKTIDADFSQWHFDVEQNRHQPESHRQHPRGRAPDLSSEVMLAAVVSRSADNRTVWQYNHFDIGKIISSHLSHSFICISKFSQSTFCNLLKSSVYQDILSTLISITIKSSLSVYSNGTTSNEGNIDYSQPSRFK